MTQKDTFTGRQLKLLEALVSGASVDDAAKASGISRRQIYRMMQEPAFIVELRRRQSEVLELASRRLAALSLTATDALADVLAEPSQSGAGNKRLAAVAVLDSVYKWCELVDIERRLSELEAKNRG